MEWLDHRFNASATRDELPSMQRDMILRNFLVSEYTSIRDPIVLDCFHLEAYSWEVDSNIHLSFLLRLDDNLFDAKGHKLT